jgi:UV DNA damage endonuclease
VYGDKASALDRFCVNFELLPDSVKTRLTVENDDKASMYSVLDLYHGVFKKVQIPIVFDYHHHKFQTGGLDEETALALAGSTWRIGIRQCTHYSESRREEQTLIVENIMTKNNISKDVLHEWPTIETLHKEASKIKLQAHSDYITEEIKDYGLDIDVVIEAKAKELTVARYKQEYSTSKLINNQI